MIQCQICQVANEDEAQFCRECGGRLTPAKPPSPVNVPAPQMPAPQIPAPAASNTASSAARPKLRSPLFGGGDDEGTAPDLDDDDDDMPSLNKGKGKGLRSPLLGGADGDDEDEPRARDKKPKGAPRPLFGGGGGDHGKNKDHKSTFPHRTHEIDDEEPRPAAKLEAGRHQAKGLRSPLLGGDDFDPEESFEDPGIQGKAAGQVKAHHRLRSPVLGGGSDDDYEDEIFDEVDDTDDPNVLRSPLLAVKTPRPKTGASPASPAPLAPVQQQAAFQPAPEPYTPAAPARVQQPLPGYQGSYVNGPNANPAAQNASSTQNSAPAQYPPVAPSSAPSYEPKPAPSPSSSQFAMPAQPMSPGPQSYQQPPAARPMPPAAPMQPMPAPPVPSASDSPSPTSDSERKGMRGSRLLGGDSSDDDEDLLVGPRDRRSKSRERRAASRSDRRSSINVDDDDMLDSPMLSRGGGSSAPGNPMAPLLMASAAVALMCKVYVFLPQLGVPDLFTKYLPSVVDQVSTMAVLLCLIMFALKSSQSK